MAKIKCSICHATMSKDFTGYLYFARGKAICPVCLSKANAPKFGELTKVEEPVRTSPKKESMEEVKAEPSPRKEETAQESFTF
ncbi:MAG: hypothetical protein QXH07_02370 [Thermoplasmata archaeon]